MATTNGGSSSTCTVTPITSDDHFAQQISSLPTSCLVVIYFHAPWAEPCKQMSTILSTLAGTYEVTDSPQISFLSLDAEELEGTSEKYDVSQVPLVILQKDGQVLESVTGTDATKVRNAVERFSSRASGDTANKSGLPPAQSITKQTSSQADGAPSTNGEGLSKYAPTASDPATAPAFSSAEVSKEELNKRLAELVKAAPVMLFMKGTPSAPQCGFSRQCVSILREKSVRYGFFNILADDEVRQGLKEFSDWPTFPQVYVGGELIGGLDILKEEFENDAEFLKDYSVRA